MSPSLYLGFLRDSTPPRAALPAEPTSLSPDAIVIGWGDAGPCWKPRLTVHNQTKGWKILSIAEACLVGKVSFDTYCPVAKRKMVG